MRNSEILIEKFMRIAIEEASKSDLIGEVPVGAVIVLDKKIIGKGHNFSISRSDPTSHAEIEAIRDASKNLNNYRLVGADIYVTLEPCAMCYGAIVHSRIANIYYGARDQKSGVCGSCDDLCERSYFNHKPLIRGGIMEEDCSKILLDFFKEKRL